jgi:hypothetical protein
MESPVQVMLAGAGIATGITAGLAVWFWSRLRRIEHSVATLVTPVKGFGSAPITFEKPSRDLESQLEMVASSRSEDDVISPYFVRP